MIAKTLSGASVLDDSYGGIFSNRSFLVCGAKNSGKTILGLRFIQQGLEQNERCLYLSTMAANGAALGFSEGNRSDGGANFLFHPLV
jgi:KaiC/GvpD/RAD55 family RecA-like ATPase